jgi:hypothetical protein
MVLKIRQNMEQGMVMATGYGYSPYSNGYHEDEKPKSFFQKKKK